MKRTDIFKAVEKHLTEQVIAKAFEIGHRSQHKDGVWEKTANGWVKMNTKPVFGNKAEGAKQARETRAANKQPSPTIGGDKINDMNAVAERYGSAIMSQIRAGDNEGEPDLDDVMAVADIILEREGRTDLQDDEDDYIDFVDGISGIWQKNQRKA